MEARRAPRGAKAPRREPMQQALDYLARRPRTVAEMRRYLAGRGHAGPALDEVIERLRQIGYLDDLAYTRRFAGWASSEKPMGRIRLQAELAARGIDRLTIDRALGECFGPQQEAAALQSALDRALRSGRRPVDPAARRRLAARLMRRGFSAGRVHAALQHPAGGADDEAVPTRDEQE